MYRNILVAHDGSELSHKAVNCAINLAAAVKAHLVALHVVPRPATSSRPRRPGQLARAAQEWAANGRGLVDAVGISALAAGVSTEAIVTQSNLVAESIMKTARKHHCDLIVMASHGRTGLKRLLLGSETQHVLMHSDIPVLVLR
jgi:nucleotide-binding universal stress UspA family protein